jgi:pheromone shutdown protein TraB
MAFHSACAFWPYLIFTFRPFEQVINMHSMLRLARYYESAVKIIIHEPALRLLLTAALVILAVGTLVYRVTENWTWVDSFYFCVVTLTTIGYGDLAPTTDITKLFTVLYAFMGIGVFATFVTVLIRAPLMEAQGRDLDMLPTTSKPAMVLPERPRYRRNRLGTAPMRNRR